MAKNEKVHLARHPVPTENFNINNTQIETKKEAKYLGVWWTQDLSSHKLVEENISKARCAFFALGAIDIFQGACNPLTALSIFNTFVLPILLYGCEVWSLNDPLQEKLESFQDEIGKRILNLPKHYNNLSVRIALKWPSFRVIVLIRKLSYLAKLLSLEPTITHVKLSCFSKRTRCCPCLSMQRTRNLVWDAILGSLYELSRRGNRNSKGG